MRWLWIDRVITHEPGRRLVAIKAVSLAEDHLHDHFGAEPGREPCAVMPGCLILEGMAQTAGILVGAANAFRENVVLAKITSAELRDDVFPGQLVRYDATLERIDAAGASTVGVVDRFDPAGERWERIGEIQLMFSCLDQNLAGRDFPKENFVFSENFRVILAQLGVLPEGA